MRFLISDQHSPMTTFEDTSKMDYVEESTSQKIKQRAHDANEAQNKRQAQGRGKKNNKRNRKNHHDKKSQQEIWTEEFVSDLDFD